MASPAHYPRSTPVTSTYFDYQPASCNVSPMRPRKTDVSRLDAFHQRPESPFEYPPNASLYAKRALPPLPPMAARRPLSSRPSTDSMRSGRPSISTVDRQSYDKCLPPLPPSLHECPSLESMTSNGRQSRQRNGRGMSFRNLINRHSATSMDDIPSLTSSMSSRNSRTDSVVGDSTIGSDTASTCHMPSNRRPSLSLTHLRTASRKVNAAPPPLPTRPVTGRKHSASVSSAHRWNPFRNSDADKEDIPPMPATPPYIQELSFGKCYYFFARNCNGYVLSNGASGDACENCANAGYLGSP
ncbi:hypothetical protein AAFC00_004639 [Neodothiora populina]|uniref:Uncharacterized protein n=1 Tax=Neodothiora populina TaxID=2781224 RepID=A0ABR3P428_9PEZI